ncbi:hypothetical protein [Streptomyces sp. NPDC020362]|uniref:hypothetical protein n=1 Tax=unclassified Streptomyces TaxID=2593676 RepID=UPI0033E98FC8
MGASYGGNADPFAEVTRTTPTGGLRILLIRTGQILGLCVPLLTGAAFVLPSNRGTPAPAAWLLPCLALTLAALVLSSYLGSWPAALITSGGWLLAIAAVAPPIAEQVAKKRHAGTPEALLVEALPDVANGLIGSGSQILYGVVATVCAELLVLRRHAFDRPGAR